MIKEKNPRGSKKDRNDRRRYKDGKAEDNRKSKSQHAEQEVSKDWNAKDLERRNKQKRGKNGKDFDDDFDDAGKIVREGREGSRLDSELDERYGSRYENASKLRSKRYNSEIDSRGEPDEDGRDGRGVSEQESDAEGDLRTVVKSRSKDKRHSKSIAGNRRNLSGMRSPQEDDEHEDMDEDAAEDDDKGDERAPRSM